MWFYRRVKKVTLQVKDVAKQKYKKETSQTKQSQFLTQGVQLSLESISCNVYNK